MQSATKISLATLVVAVDAHGRQVTAGHSSTVVGAHGPQESPFGDRLPVGHLSSQSFGLFIHRKSPMKAPGSGFLVTVSYTHLTLPTKA